MTNSVPNAWDMSETAPSEQPGVVRLGRLGPGIILKIARDPLSAIPRACYEERMALARFFGRRTAYVTDPALLQEALVRRADHLHKTEDMRRMLGPALGQGILTADGAVWRWQRQAMASAFQHERLMEMLPAMIAVAEGRRDRWRALTDGAVLDLGHEMMETTFEIIVETVLTRGRDFDMARIERSMSDYLKATSIMLALSILRMPTWTPFPGRGRALAGVKYLRGRLHGRLAAARSENAGGPNLMRLLIEAKDPESGRTLDDEAIVDNLVTLASAGHETTALALTWTLALMTRHPDVAARMRAEVEEVTGAADVAPQHVLAMNYCRQVVNEAMRLYPPAPIISREVMRPFELGGVSLPAGTNLMVPIHAVHWHKVTWPDPERFDPERFAPDAVRSRHRMAFMPFGAGPRICIGNSFAMLESVAILAVLFKAGLVERLRLTGPLPDATMSVTLRPKQPILARLAG